MVAVVILDDGRVAIGLQMDTETYNLGTDVALEVAASLVAAARDMIDPDKLAAMLAEPEGMVQ